MFLNITHFRKGPAMNEEGIGDLSAEQDALLRYMEATSQALNDLREQSQLNSANLAAINMVIATQVALDPQLKEAIRTMANSMFSPSPGNQAVADVRECIERDFGVEL
ncbi:hypothetical protein ACOTJG_25650 [Achromobacter xylosoxidans]|uniref:hypothetical protein n=1 Tax=Alcaligenes xylosoxydans xylosoxydans TaxID=85698 RepID=UPI0010418DFC|nr:hypothetical protein [Achromobacter xylosoxidans]